MQFHLIPSTPEEPEAEHWVPEGQTAGDQERDEGVLGGLDPQLLHLLLQLSGQFCHQRGQPNIICSEALNQLHSYSWRPRN